MPNCDMCGTESESLLVASIEGVDLNVCSNCAKFGKVLRSVPKKISPKKQKRQENQKLNAPDIEETMQLVVEDYDKLIKEAREKLNLKPEDFANQINEKLSLIHHIESGKAEPSIDLARKIERFLKIKLIDQYQETHNILKGNKSEGFTLGDFIKIRKKQ